MKLTRIEIKNYRSLFLDSSGKGFELDVAEGMNALVGPNNTGKSNVLRAIAMALNPDYDFDMERDRPGGLLWAYPRVILEFHSEGRTGVERTLLRYAREYERSAIKPGKKPYAADGIIRLRVSYVGGERSQGIRQEQLQIRGAGARIGDPEKLAKTLAKLREAHRFVMIESGQDLHTLLAGKFREILHSVIKENLKKDFDQAQRRRSGYIEGLRQDLLSPLQVRIGEVLGDLFPEIEHVSLIPTVTDINETLSNVGINLRDAVDTELAAKGTGVRGAVMVAMLRYLAEHSKRSVVFAVEEPETFLHPAAQEELRDDLESLAERNDVSLLVTTHSPFIVSREAKSQVVAITKDKEGRTRILGAARGDRPNASLLGGLFRDTTIADVIDRATQIPEHTRGIVVVEGSTDGDYMKLAAKKAKRPDLFADLHIIVAGGAQKAIAEAVLTKAQTPLPVVAVFDSDQVGRDAAETLRRKFSFSTDEVLLYSELLDGKPADIEAEDFFPKEILQSFVDEAGEETVLAEKRRHPQTGHWHYGFSAIGKELFPEFLERNGKATHFDRWIEVLLILRRKLRLGGPPTEREKAVARPAAAANGLVEELRKRVLALGNGITERATKRGGYAFKVNKRAFVTIIPRKSGARLGLALREPFDDPEGLTRKVPNGAGVWSFDARINAGQLGATLLLIRQAYEQEA